MTPAYEAHRKTGICHARELTIRSNYFNKSMEPICIYRLEPQNLVRKMEYGVCASVVSSVCQWGPHRLWKYYRQAALPTAAHLCILWLHNMWFSEHWTRRNLASFQNPTQIIKDSVPNDFSSSCCIKCNITQQNNLVQFVSQWFLFSFSAYNALAIQESKKMKSQIEIQLFKPTLLISIGSKARQNVSSKEISSKALTPHTEG